MPNPISSDVKEKLEDLYYNKKFMFGRDKLYHLARERGWCFEKTDSRFFKKTRIISIILSIRRMQGITINNIK